MNLSAVFFVVIVTAIHTFILHLLAHTTHNIIFTGVVTILSSSYCWLLYRVSFYIVTFAITNVLTPLEPCKQMNKQTKNNLP